MPLKIEFDNSGGDIHIMIRDGCRIRKDQEDPNLSDFQKITREGLQGYLVYMNCYPFEIFYFDQEERLKIYCPTCKSEYSLTREEYNKKLDEFWRIEDEKWREVREAAERNYSK